MIVYIGVEFYNQFSSLFKVSPLVLIHSNEINRILMARIKRDEEKVKRRRKSGHWLNVMEIPCLVGNAREMNGFG